MRWASGRGRAEAPGVSKGTPLSPGAGTPQNELPATLSFVFTEPSEIGSHGIADAGRHATHYRDEKSAGEDTDGQDDVGTHAHIVAGLLDGVASLLAGLAPQASSVLARATPPLCPDISSATMPAWRTLVG